MAAVRLANIHATAYANAAVAETADHRMPTASSPVLRM
jgi:hypothetical protein